MLTFFDPTTEYGPLTGVEVEPFLSPPETNGFEDGPPRKMARFA